jgi:hypothetical protein
MPLLFVETEKYPTYLTGLAISQITKWGDNPRNNIAEVTCGQGHGLCPVQLLLFVEIEKFSSFQNMLNGRTVQSLDAGDIENISLYEFYYPVLSVM